MANRVSVLFEIDKDEKGRATLRQIDQGIDKIGKTAGQAGPQIESGLGAFKGLIVVELFRRAAGAAYEFGKTSVAAFNDARNAALGLESVAAFKGIDRTSASEAVRNLEVVKSGLLSFADASQTVRNFLKTGFDLEQSIALTRRFSDAAAFGKTASLSFGEAVRSASEGVATQSSQLLNNIGIVTNLSTFLERQGLTLDDLTSKTKGTAAATALFNGLMNDTADAVGNAVKFSGTFAGDLARLESGYNKLEQAAGEAVVSNDSFQRGMQEAGKAVEFVTGKLSDANSGIGGFARTITTEFGATLQTINSVIKAIDYALDLFNRFEPLHQLFGTGPTESATDRANRQNFEQLRSEYLKKQKELESQAKLAQSVRIADTKQEAEAWKQVTEESKRFTKELESTNQKYAELKRDAGDLIGKLKADASDNPLVRLYTEANRAQGDFMQRFREVPREMRAEFLALNEELKGLNAFKLVTSTGGQVFSLQRALSELQAGLGGSAISKEAADRAARRAAIEQEIFERRRAGTLDGATQNQLLDEYRQTLQRSPESRINESATQRAVDFGRQLLQKAGDSQAKQQVALDYIIGSTSDISKLTSEQSAARTQALERRLKIEEENLNKQIKAADTIAAAATTMKAAADVQAKNAGVEITIKNESPESASASVQKELGPAPTAQSGNTFSNNY